MTHTVRSLSRLAVTAIMVAVAVAAVGFGTHPAAAQTQSVVNTGGPYVGSIGVPITFTGSAAISAPIISYNWDFGDGSTGTGSITQHAYTSTGTFTVTLTVTTSGGQTYTGTTTANINQFPSTLVSTYTPYIVGSYGTSPYIASPYVTTPYVTGPYVVSPYAVGSYVTSPYFSTCGVPVVAGRSVVTSACTGPFATTWPSYGVGCFNQPLVTPFGTSYRRVC